MVISVANRRFPPKMIVFINMIYTCHVISLCQRLSQADAFICLDSLFTLLLSTKAFKTFMSSDGTFLLSIHYKLQYLHLVTSLYFVYNLIRMSFILKDTSSVARCDCLLRLHNKRKCEIILVIWCNVIVAQKYKKNHLLQSFMYTLCTIV